MSNYRQMFVAISLYRSGEGKDGLFGTPREMGLPPSFKAMPEVDRLACRGIFPWNCRAGDNGYLIWPVDLPGLYDEALHLQWAEYTKRFQDATVLVRDIGHQVSCPTSDFALNRGLGLSLSGAIFWRRGRGDPMRLFWWNDMHGEGYRE